MASAIRSVIQAKTRSDDRKHSAHRLLLLRLERMRTLIQDGSIGEPRAVLAQQFRRVSDVPREAWKLDPAVSGGGHFADMYPNALDWLRCVFGAMTQIHGTVANQPRAGRAEDLVVSPWT